MRATRIMLISLFILSQEISPSLLYKEFKRDFKYLFDGAGH